MQDYVDCWYTHEHDTSEKTYYSADFQPIASYMYAWTNNLYIF